MLSGPVVVLAGASPVTELTQAVRWLPCPLAITAARERARPLQRVVLVTAVRQCDVILMLSSRYSLGHVATMTDVSRSRARDDCNDILRKTCVCH